MIDESDLLYNFLKEYEQWLRNNKISPEFVKEELRDNYKGILLRAFRRKKTKNWNYTKYQKKIIKYIAESELNKKYLEKE